MVNEIHEKEKTYFVGKIMFIPLILNIEGY